MIESLRTTQIAFFRFATLCGFFRGSADEVQKVSVQEKLIWNHLWEHRFSVPDPRVFPPPGGRFSPQTTESPFYDWAHRQPSKYIINQGLISIGYSCWPCDSIMGKVMKLRIYENLICELRSEELKEGGDHRMLYRQLLQLRKESLKKIQACTGFESLTSAIQRSSARCAAPVSQRSRVRIPLMSRFARSSKNCDFSLCCEKSQVWRFFAVLYLVHNH